MTGRHETTDLNPKYVLYFFIGLTIAAAIIHGGIWWMLTQFEQEQARQQIQPSQVPAQAAAPEPHLQISPQAELEKMLREQKDILSRYEWTGRGKATARIPIDRAMQLLVEMQGAEKK